MKKRIFFLMGALVFVAAAVSFYRYRNASYAIIHPKRAPITEAIYGLGRVKTNKRFEVIIGVISTVTRLHVEEGEFVNQGAPLIAFESGSTFRAPFAGTVTFVRAREGETAVPQQTILRLEDLRDRFIELSLEQQAALRIKPGNTAKVSFESLRGTILSGTVTSLFSRANEFLAHIRVDGLEPSVLPGMTADVTVEVGTIPDALLIPVSAIQNGMVTVKRDGSWQKLKVEVGFVDGVFAEIKGDTLKLEDEIRVKKD